jgi:hypothetical protein
MQVPEEIFIEQFVTPARVEKIKQKIMTDKNTGWQTQYIGELLGRVWYDIFQEELWSFVKNGRIKSFDFKIANQLCIIKTKQIIGL